MQFDSFINYETLEDWVERFVSNHGKLLQNSDHSKSEVTL